MEKHYDLIILGGGIHGAAIAADAAGRGLSVFLCEQNDFAQGTSSASSKLIHGGLRYLEQFDFQLVFQSLQEREHLIQMAPHLVHPMPFQIPLNHSVRSPWLLKLGLYFYDLLAQSRQFPHARFSESALQYFDATVDDARLVITTLLRAQSHGAILCSYTKCLQAEETASGWRVSLHNQISNLTYHIEGRILINATGPWINEVLSNIIHQKSQYQARLIQGSHIVVPKITSDTAYLLQHSDKRIIFVIPYQEDFSLIGTTDVAYSKSPEEVKISQEEIHYLCDIVSTYFSTQLSPSDIIASWSGVRSLADDSHALPFSNSREYKIEHTHSARFKLPLLNIYGGKMTTHRRLAEKAVNQLMRYFPLFREPWTKTCPLPGGNLPQNNWHLFVQSLQNEYPWAPQSMLIRYAKSYGTLIYCVLEDANSIEDLGEHFGHHLYEKEIQYLIKYEWAVHLDDILWRRTKLGLYLTENEKNTLQEWMKGTTNSLNYLRAMQ